MQPEEIRRGMRCVYVREPVTELVSPEEEKIRWSKEV